MPIRQGIIWIFALVALGVATTVLLAWSCVVLSNPYKRPLFLDRGSPDESWNITRGESFGSAFIHCLRVRNTGARANRMMHEGPSLLPNWRPLHDELAPFPDLAIAGKDYRSGATTSECRWINMHGWPLPALSCEYVVDGKGYGVSVRWGALLPIEAYSLPPYSGIRTLPFRPMWLGFAADTLVFSAMWWIALIGIPLFRSHIRRWRGRCPGCNYQLLGKFDDGCPECGLGKAMEEVGGPS